MKFRQDGLPIQRPQYVADVARAKIARGYTHAIIVWYAYAGKQRHQIISCHRSYERARKQIQKDTGNFWAVVTLSEYVD